MLCAMLHALPGGPVPFKAPNVTYVNILTHRHMRRAIALAVYYEASDARYARPEGLLGYISSRERIPGYEILI